MIRSGKKNEEIEMVSVYLLFLCKQLYNFFGVNNCDDVCAMRKNDRINILILSRT